jgi:hypothetical protein
VLRQCRVRPNAVLICCAPPLAESYAGLDTPNYYSVAVVRAADCAADTTLESLRGKRSCHTGYGRTAGWTLPVGFLIGSGTVSALLVLQRAVRRSVPCTAWCRGGWAGRGHLPSSWRQGWGVQLRSLPPPHHLQALPLSTPSLSG